MGMITFGYPDDEKPKIIVTLSDHGWFEIKDYELRKKAKYCSKMYKDKNGKWRSRTNPDYTKSIIISKDLKYKYFGERLCRELLEEPYDPVKGRYLYYREYKNRVIYDILELDDEDLRKVADILFEKHKNHPRIKKLLKEDQNETKTKRTVR